MQITKKYAQLFLLTGFISPSSINFAAHMQRHRQETFDNKVWRRLPQSNQDLIKSFLYQPFKHNNTEQDPQILEVDPSLIQAIIPESDIYYYYWWKDHGGYIVNKQGYVQSFPVNINVNSPEFTIFNATQFIRDNPATSFTAFAHHGPIKPYVHESQTQKIKDLSLVQLNCIKELFKTQQVLNRAGKRSQNACRWDLPLLSPEQIAIFCSLPKDIQRNLCKVYHIRYPQIMLSAYPQELAPALCPFSCKHPIQQAIARIKKIIAEEHACYGSNPVAIIATSLIYDPASKRATTIHHAYDKDNRQSKCLLGLGNKLQVILQNIQQQENSLVIVGLSNGEIEIYFSPQAMLALEQLSLEQFSFIIKLHDKAQDNATKIFLEQEDVELFYTLPKTTQRNLQKNYRLQTSFTTKYTVKGSRYSQKFARLAKQYARYKNKPYIQASITIIKAACIALLIYYSLRGASSTKIVRYNNKNLLKLLTHKKKLLLAIAALVAAGDCSTKCANINYAIPFSL
jgi:hypothetical protein